MMTMIPRPRPLRAGLRRPRREACALYIAALDRGHGEAPPAWWRRPGRRYAPK